MYVREECNVRAISTCSDPLRYADVRAEPDWPALGARLGAALGRVGAAAKALRQEAVLQYEAEGKLLVAGVELRQGDLKIRRVFRQPEGTTPGECVLAAEGHHAR